VRRHYVLAKWKPKTCPNLSVCSIPYGFDFVFENIRQDFIRNPNPRVLDSERSRPYCANGYRPASRGEFNRIGQQIKQNLADQSPVSKKRASGEVSLIT
jgi:hypothetical protein